MEINSCNHSTKFRCFIFKKSKNKPISSLRTDKIINQLLLRSENIYFEYISNAIQFIDLYTGVK